MCTPGETCKQLGLYDLQYRGCVLVANPAAADVFDTPFSGPRKSFCGLGGSGPGSALSRDFENQPARGEQCVSKFLTKKRQYKRYAKGCSYNPKKRKRLAKKQGFELGSLVWNGAGGKNGYFGKEKTSRKGNKHYRPLCCNDEELCQEWEENVIAYYYGSEDSEDSYYSSDYTYAKGDE